MSAEVPASRKIKHITGTLFSNILSEAGMVLLHIQHWYVLQLSGIIYHHTLQPNTQAYQQLTISFGVLLAVGFWIEILVFVLLKCATKGMLARRVLGRSKRKGGRGGKSTGGPGWGHGHTCCSLYVIYCPEPRQQSVEFKEICNEKFLIQRPKALVEPCLLPLSLLHAINTYIRRIKSLDLAMSYACALASVKTSHSLLSSLNKESVGVMNFT